MSQKYISRATEEMTELNEKGERVYKKNLGVTIRDIELIDNQTFQQCPTPSASHIVVRSIILQTLVQLIDNIIPGPHHEQHVAKHISSLKTFMHQSFKKDLIFAKKRE